MAVVEVKNLMERVGLVLGDNTSDEALALMEDLSDTLAARPTVTAEVDWDSDDNPHKKRADDIAKKYRDRFMGQGGDDEQSVTGDVKEVKKVTVDDIFKEGV